MMSKLELRISEVAEATGRIVAVGRQGHKDEWFANCDGIESPATPRQRRWRQS